MERQWEVAAIYMGRLVVSRVTKKDTYLTGEGHMRELLRL
jgi:hypothetical protein